MAEKQCPDCGLENDPRRLYCRDCGGRLPEPKRPGLRGLFRGWRADSMAGFGQRGVNFAPLATAGLFHAEDTVDHREDAPVEYLPDHSWYCPFCGVRNGTCQSVCKGCGRQA